MADNKIEMEHGELHRAIWAIADELRGAGVPVQRGIRERELL